MFYIIYLFYFINLYLINGIPQINLYYTDWIQENDNAIQYNCLRIAASIEHANVNREILFYCMNEFSLKFNITENDFYPKFTFAELLEQNITSEQLYHWSAPIDLIEDYQFYLNQLLISNNSFLSRKNFYNCTMPRFGSMCQYEFDYQYSHHSSLYEIIYDFYRTNTYRPNDFTCYIHFECNRGPYPSCLDWSEICDGKIDCLNGNYDEEHCWQLEINECQYNEFRCKNGQCIPQSFYQDDSNIPDCIDLSDKFLNDYQKFINCETNQPSFGCEDVTCPHSVLTNSCVERRKRLLLEAMFSIKDDSLSDECWIAFKCLTYVVSSIELQCISFCENETCIEIVLRTCPNMLYAPFVPIIFGHIYFVYSKDILQHVPYINWHFQYVYVCYNNSRYENYFVNDTKILVKNITCFPRYDLQNVIVDILFYEKHNLGKFYDDIWKYNEIYNYTSIICSKSSMYQCINSSKCISKSRLMDGISDCPYMDDEKKIKINSTDLTDEDIGIADMLDGELKDKLRYVRKNILFQIVCDGFIELFPININGQNETDETECQQWECNNIYTRCNNISNCPNGQDEIGCYVSLSINCSSNDHICISPYTNQFMCLPIEKANDGNVDCLGAIDEPTLCQRNHQLNYYYNFYCRNYSLRSCIGYKSLCDGRQDCNQDDDEQFCKKDPFTFIPAGICVLFFQSYPTEIEIFLCDRMKPWVEQPIIYFSLNKLIKKQSKNIENRIHSSSFMIKQSNEFKPNCHRGLDLRVWLNDKKNLTIMTCLCPPSFYGNICQYQNQRISLVIQFQALSDSWQTLFTIVILLSDDTNERIIHSYEQFTYLSIRDCKIKYNIYLLYSTRPKNMTKNYFIHIDIYEKISLTYRGSLLSPIKFPFLPVYRLALIINIPKSNNNNLQSCSNNQCNHGKCMRYLNQPENLTFCQCDQGWSGKFCTIKYNSTCSSDSLSIGISYNNQSICVCPINKFGSRCLINNSICHMNNNGRYCNGGQCIPNDEYMVSNEKFTCICPRGFSGDRCEIIDNKIILSFEKNIILSETMSIHFIQIINNAPPIRTTSLRRILLKNNSMIIDWSRPFHLVFIELFKHNYYLTVFQKFYNQSEIIIKKINSSDRCLHINEIFNKTFIQWHLIRRIKYYHLPCQNSSLNLSCCYDDIHFCLCYDYGQKRLSNCFQFNHNMTFDCFGQSECENKGQCLQDSPNCPKYSICVCRPCFYGRRCQFSTSGFGLSLDAILGYHILPNVSIIHQPPIIKTSLALTIIVIIVGFINGILAMITFKNKIVREVGCGIYLLGGSINTLFIMIIFGLKFSILILSQMTIIENRLFINIQCISLDFLLRICLNMDQWLNACVAIERAVMAIKGIHFDKKKSKKIAKLIILILLIIIIGTVIQDPIYRRLIDEENDDGEKRIWCIVSYSSGLQTFNSFINSFQFFAPFLINLISSIILITKKSQQESHIQVNRTYKEIFFEHIRQQKHLFIGPVILVIFALPRLIISYVSKCMKSTNDSWLFLIGYFISLIPPMLTFIIFILPSKFYKKEFRKSVAQYRTTIRNRLNFNS